MECFFYNTFSNTSQYVTQLHKALITLYKTWPNIYNTIQTLHKSTQRTKLYTTLHNFTTLYNTLHNFTKLYTSLARFTKTLLFYLKLYRALQVCTQLYNIVHNKQNTTISEFYKKAQNLTILYTTFQHYTEL